MNLPIRSTKVLPILLTALAFIHIFYESEQMLPGTLNDEAVEMLQVIDFPADGFYFLPPLTKEVSAASSVAFLSDNSLALQGIQFLPTGSKCARERTVFDDGEKVGHVLEINPLCKAKKK